MKGGSGICCVFLLWVPLPFHFRKGIHMKYYKKYKSKHEAMSYDLDTILDDLKKLRAGK